MERSDSIAKLIPALVAAKKAFPAIAKTLVAKIPGREYRYADIAIILLTIEPVLSANGLALVQDQKRTEHGLEIKTALFHESGEFIASEWLAMTLAPSANAQAVGSASTYGRRYSLGAFLSIATEDDDDGNGADGDDKNKPPANTTGRPRNAPAGNAPSGNQHAGKPASTPPAKREMPGDVAQFLSDFEQAIIERIPGTNGRAAISLLEKQLKARKLDVYTLQGDVMRKIMAAVCDGDFDKYFKEPAQKAAA